MRSEVPVNIWPITKPQIHSVPVTPSPGYQPLFPQGLWESASRDRHYYLSPHWGLHLRRPSLKQQAVVDGSQ